jgi:dihydroorotate dehydrogenase (fumarate)
MDITTKYLGLPLKHPIVAAASPLSRELDGIKRLEDAGASAIVMPSLFEEEIEHELNLIDHFLNYGTESYVEAVSYLPEPQTALKASDTYLTTLREAKASVKVPIIASLNGATSGGWIKYATMMEEAGADALELNLYYLATDPEVPGHVLEQEYLKTIKFAVSCVNIPVSVKIGPYFSSIPFFAKEIASSGVKGLVLFNRFYQPDIDLESLSIAPTLTLSRSEDLRLPLRWTALLSSQLDMDIAITSGIHSGTDVLKAMMVGARVAQVASELLQNGEKRITEILDEMNHWMEVHEYASIRQMRGSMNYKGVADPAAYERANYQQVLKSFPVETSGLSRK